MNEYNFNLLIKSINLINVLLITLINGLLIN